MKAPKFVVFGFLLGFGLSLFTVFAQALPQKPQEPKKPEAKPAQREIIPKEIRAIMQEGLATRQGRQDIPFTIFKSLVFPVRGGMHAVIFFKAKNSDIGYAAPAPAAPAPKNQPAQPAPAAPAAGMLEARLALALEYLQPDATGALKTYKDATFGVNLQTESAGYDPNKEEWYSFGYPLPFGKYTLVMLFTHIDPKTGKPDIKKVGVGYYDLVLPGPETYQNALDTTPLFLVRDIKQMQSADARPTIHKGFFTYSILQMIPNMDSIVAAEEKSQIEPFFFVLGAKEAPADPAVQSQLPRNQIEITYAVEKARAEEELISKESPALILGTWDWSRTSEGSHIEVRGEVKNVSAGNLKDVEAVVTFRDNSGKYISHESAILEYNPIVAGQTSPFKIISTYNPEITDAIIEFKTIAGDKVKSSNRVDTVIRWQAQNYVSPLIDQALPLMRTLKTGEKTEQKDLEAGKYTLVIKIMDKVSGLTLDKKMPFEVK